MWNRKELKAKGKAAFKANYWRSVVAGLLLTVAIAAFGGGSTSAGRSAAEEAERSAEIEASLQELQEVQAQYPEEFAQVMTVFVGTILGIALVLKLFDIFVFNPLEVGGRRFFLSNSDSPARVSEVGYGFKNRYMNVVATIFLRDLFLALWALLFLVPACVKAYSYRMVPYILAENPDMKPKEVINLSRQMMNGHKLNTFILDLTFFGWEFLAVLTCGLVGVFYVNPYMYATGAELYKAIKNG